MMNAHPWAEIQSILRRRGYGLGSSGPLKDGVDGEPGGLTGAAVLAELLKMEKNQPAPIPEKQGLAEPDAFFGSLRKSGLFVDGLKQEQVDGINVILAECAAACWPLSWTAYGLATAYWETNKSMQPVEEAYYLEGQVRDLDAWRRKNLRYYPWHGRGYPQTTWERNYQKADDELRLGGRLMKDPSLMLTAEVAAPTMIRGMQEGWFTSKKLSDTLPSGRPATFAEFKHSRPIINGRDKDDEIANVALRMQAALQAGGWA